MQHGLVITANSLGTVPWYNFATGYVAVGTPYTNPFGTGLSDTDLIVTAQGAVLTDYAAGLARSYTGGGYSDWYLANVNEWKAICINRTILGLSETHHWTCGEYGMSPATYAMTFIPSAGCNNVNAMAKNSDGVATYAVRSF